MPRSKRSTKASIKRHNKTMAVFIADMVIRRFEDRRDIAKYFVDAISNNRPIDDIYGELVNWAAEKYGEHNGY